MKDILIKEQHKEAEKMIHHWKFRIMDMENDISRYDFETDMAGIHTLFDKPPQNAQSFLQDYANKHIEFRDLFIALYGEHQKEEDIIREWENEELPDFRQKIIPLVKEFLELLYIGSPNWKTKLVYDYLNNIDMNNIKIIQTVMYIGRDHDASDNKNPKAIYCEKKKELDFSGWYSREAEINQMLGKGSLDKYLIDGLKILEQVN